MPRATFKTVASYTFLSLVALGGLGWIWLLGDVLVIMPVWAVLAFGVAPPLLLLWLSFFAIRSSNDQSRGQILIAVAATVLAVPLAFQLGHPRAMFVQKLASLRIGMHQADVERTMSGYLGGQPYSIDSDSYVPDELVGAGVTHIMSYRWNGIDGRYTADIGQVFLRDGRVVGTRFMPD